MKMLQTYGNVALVALVLGGMGLTPAEAAYKPKIESKMGGQYKKDVQNVVTYLKGLPKTLRWLFIAERMGILFMPKDGTIGHINISTGYSKNGAHFIGADGLEYDTKAEMKVIPALKVWVANSDTTDRLGREVVFSKLSGEVTALILENAKYQLKKLAEEQPEKRDMYLAYLAELCYLPDGKKPYNKKITRNIPGVPAFQVYDLLQTGCKFIDTEGVEQDYDAVAEKYDDRKAQRWEILDVCAHHVGKKDILALYPEEVKKLRDNYKKKMQEFGGDTEATQEKTAKQKSAQEGQNVSLAKKIGVKYRPQTSSGNIGGQYKKELQNAVAAFNTMPKSLRWTFFSEKMGLLFMPKDGVSGHRDGGSMQDGAHFIGANGTEYDAKAEFNARPNTGIWAACCKNITQFGLEEVLSQFPDEIAELVLQNAKYHLNKMGERQPERKQMYLAYLAELCYLPDGKNPYSKKITRNISGVPPFQVYDLANTGCQFVDTEGTVMDFDSVAKMYAHEKDQRWEILDICTHHIGKEAILALFPEEVKKLRANYEEKMEEFKE